MQSIIPQVHYWGQLQNTSVFTTVCKQAEWQSLSAEKNGTPHCLSTKYFFFAHCLKISNAYLTIMSHFSPKKKITTSPDCLPLKDSLGQVSNEIGKLLQPTTTKWSNLHIHLKLNREISFINMHKKKKTMPHWTQCLDNVC